MVNWKKFFIKRLRERKKERGRNYGRKIKIYEVQNEEF